MTTKNLLAVQLTEAQQIIANLQAEIADLTQQLDEATKPADEIIEGE
jgi:F0F1-type ATP synthase membrane subunit b/b'